jgi:hypothetical protein
MEQSLVLGPTWRRSLKSRDYECGRPNAECRIPGEMRGVRGDTALQLAPHFRRAPEAHDL